MALVVSVSLHRDKTSQFPFPKKLALAIVQRDLQQPMASQTVLENYFFLMVNAPSDSKKNQPPLRVASETRKRKRCDSDDGGNIQWPQLAQLIKMIHHFI